ncbi:DUF4274 domain-containing protein [Aquimarina sp. SS2-1]|uniref:DUF4274 domain-containing protein n=1 Tax=Aquimarina besae TaxID=3342247 RepID=UPI0036716567
MKKKITEEQYQKLEDEVWEAFLSNASPIEVYHSLITSNFDDNDYLLNWILTNPKVDKAIALTAYWMSEPYYSKQFLDRQDCLNKESWHVEAFDYIEALEHNYCNGFYEISNLQCDPGNVEIDQETDWTQLNPTNMKPIRNIPNQMFEKLKGKPVPPVDYYAYTEGLPNIYYDKIDAIFEEYEIEY